MNPGWLSLFLNRGKDSSDNEWNNFTEAFTVRGVWMYYIGYVVASRLALNFYANVYMSHVYTIRHVDEHDFHLFKVKV